MIELTIIWYGIVGIIKGYVEKKIIQKMTKIKSLLKVT